MKVIGLLLVAIVSMVASVRPAVPHSTSVLFVGDIMLDRAVARHASSTGAQALYKGALPLFLESDVSVANLEGTITDQPSISQKDNSILRFTFDPSFARNVLHGLTVTAVTVANNHAYDFGQQGLDQTLQNLRADDVFYFGSPLNRDTLSTRIPTLSGMLCLVGYHAFTNPDPAPIIAEIKTIRPTCWKEVVFTHWGQEYWAGATNAQRTVGHAFIDAGADLVVGSHPHVVEPVEMYNNRAIFYSLGNFLFDQDFSFETQHSLALKVQFFDDTTRFTLVPLTIAREEVSIADQGAARAVLQDLVDDQVPQAVAAAIAKGSFELANRPQ